MTATLKTLFLILIMTSQPLLAQTSVDVSSLMPNEKDHTSMWWRDGFPGKVKGADWRRMTKTGHYWFVLDTDTVTIPRLGAGQVNDVPGVHLELAISANGKTYACERGGDFSRFTGPRIIESGQFLQRQDITDLEFVAADGDRLNVEARFEAAAWCDQLALSLAARPGKRRILEGEKCWGRKSGGFGLTGKNQYIIPETELKIPKQFTVAFWAMPDAGFLASKNGPWLVCYGPHEEADGHFGVVLDREGVPSLTMNVGGGRENVVIERARNGSLSVNKWSHVAIRYDGHTAQLWLDGRKVIEKKIDKSRSDSKGLLSFGNRGDQSSGYFFRGVIDEVTVFDRELNDRELSDLKRYGNNSLKPIVYRGFNSDAEGFDRRPRDRWENAHLSISIFRAGKRLQSKVPFKSNHGAECRAHILLDPTKLEKLSDRSPVQVVAIDKHSGKKQAVEFEPEIGWHRVNLDGIQPTLPNGSHQPSNDTLERIKLTVANPTDREQVARLMFEKTRGGIKQRIGQSITGVTAVIRDAQGNPTGIPVQLSKNWHFHDSGGVYQGLWFHGISQLRLPAQKSVELELVIAYGHWGGVAAATHSQLSLIGWGFNQVWDQSALGSWGESICYEPEQAITSNIITDVRPLMVRGMSSRDTKWGWTNNVGGGDFFRTFDAKGDQQSHASVRANYKKVGPCLTEVNYQGGINQLPISQESTVSLSRTDDLVCGTYRLRCYVNKPTELSRFVIFQAGADTYSVVKHKKVAVGDESGVNHVWTARWGGDQYRGKPIECVGGNAWVSLHDTIDKTGNKGALANRGFVIREWRARLGGEFVNPWIAERGIGSNERAQNSTIDIVPPPHVTKLLKGDFVEATIEHVIVPQFAKDYYGSNQPLREALEKQQNTWRMIHRHAVGNKIQADVKQGKLQHRYPDVAVQVATNQTAEFTLRGGLGYVPITFTDLNSYHDYQLSIDGELVDQSVHGKDFWQTNFDPKSKCWSRTYNVQIPENKSVQVKFIKLP